MEEKIQKLLMESCHYSLAEAKETAKNICSFSQEDLRNAVRQWVIDGSFTEVKEKNYTVSGLMKHYGMAYPAALVFIDWYRDEPEVAEAVLQRLEEILS